MKSFIRIFSLSALAALVLTGCQTPVAVDPKTGQDQTAVYQAGYFTGPVSGNMGDIFKVAIREMDELGYFRTGELHKSTYISIYGRKIGDKHVSLRIKQLADGQSELRIRIGRLGNLAESQVLYARIRDAL